ncbi:MAG TPA: hypothetical protein VEF55_05255 [Candidatus Binatia bacterium]|nr:hypothetical protein [Candidatus Binatia bacterium]
MTYASHTVDTLPVARTDFHRSERLITLIGACAFGAMLGFGVAVAVGQADMWTLFLAAAVVLAIALYPAAANMADASASRSPGCTLAATTHIGALLVWPLAAQFAGNLYWLVPATALSSLVLLASCWSGSSRVVYRMSVQGVLVAALAAHQGTMLAMGA